MKKQYKKCELNIVLINEEIVLSSGEWQPTVSTASPEPTVTIDWQEPERTYW